MIKSELSKLIASTLVITSVLALNPIGASAEWKSNSTGWWYTEGNSLSHKFLTKTSEVQKLPDISSN